jgi:hypothetical protein
LLRAQLHLSFETARDDAVGVVAPNRYLCALANGKKKQNLPACVSESPSAIFMDKTDPPMSFGVFKPQGHVLITFETATQSQAAVTALLAQGFTHGDIAHYTAQEMAAQAHANLLTASPLASLGQDLNLVKAQLAQAEQGCSFLVVGAAGTEKVAYITQIARSLNARSAQRYGILIVEELITASADGKQVFESPARGLDTHAADRTN